MSSSPPPPTSAQLPVPPARRRPPINDLIESEFPPFDCEAAVVFPFQEETARDAKFQKELNSLILDCSLEFHAWASARAFHETDAATSKYEKQLEALQHKETEQEKTRQRLQDCVERMRTALALLK
ncbi:hypothetical protein MKEN_00781300 [Mycena kentingensis (nom. inval.)]|nr:hypothetical protein MKEN_00781300 [Mycena kentingensis (nom. inval.)]